MWGIIPAAGKGTRIQPLAFSKELLPLLDFGSDKSHRPRAVSDFLVERLVTGGARRICFVISPEKSDILEYYGRSTSGVSICYSVQPQPTGLCDAIFRALPLTDPNEPVLVGLPDTIWFPGDGFCHLDDNRFSFLLFRVRDPQLFDSVEMLDDGRIVRIRVKDAATSSNLIWGAFKLPGYVLRSLYELWLERDGKDEYLGTLVNAWIDRGGVAWGVPAGTTYHDVGTMDGYLEAMRMLSDETGSVAAARAFR